MRQRLGDLRAGQTALQSATQVHIELVVVSHFAYVGSVHEGFPCAVEINKAGYNAFVLKYRAGRGGGVATQDLAAALTFVFRNAVSKSTATKWPRTTTSCSVRSTHTPGLAPRTADRRPVANE